MSNDIYTAKPIETHELCERDCGLPAKFITHRGKKQCSLSHNACPSVIAKKKAKQTPEKMKKMVERSKKTKLERYGDANYVNKAKGVATMKERYGVENPGQMGDHVDKIKETNFKLYGDENYNNPEKHKQTMLDRYGVDNIFKKVEYIQECMMKKHDVINPGLKNFGYNRKLYTFPSGNEVYVQGYEPQALNILLETYTENDIKVGKEVPRISYLFEGKERKHFPDIYIYNEKRIIEVKSTYTVKDPKVLPKLEAARKSKYNYEIWIMDKSGELLECIR